MCILYFVLEHVLTLKFALALATVVSGKKTDWLTSHLQCSRFNASGFLCFFFI